METKFEPTFWKQEVSDTTLLLRAVLLLLGRHTESTVSQHGETLQVLLQPADLPVRLSLQPRHDRLHCPLRHASVHIDGLQEMREAVMKLRDAPGMAERNRCGILLATEATAGSTKTLSHVLWALCALPDVRC